MLNSERVTAVRHYTPVCDLVKIDVYAYLR